ncbi:MAG: ABC transporter ATP-binding protein [Anaerolineae bacterium]
MADPTLAIETLALTKHYGRHCAVQDLDLHVPHGVVCGFLGRNGAGKTTTIGMLVGLLRPTSGEAWLLGRDVRQDLRPALQQTGVLLEEPAFYPYLSGRENLWVVAQVLGGDAVQRIDEVLDVVDLADRSGDRFGAYSTGMKQRLGLAAALLNDPRLLILDEPAKGLDPPGQRAIRDLIQRLAHDTGKTIFLSSHQLYEVEQICDYLAVIDRGHLMAQGRLDELAAGRDLETLFMELTGGEQGDGDEPPL